MGGTTKQVDWQTGLSGSLRESILHWSHCRILLAEKSLSFHWLSSVHEFRRGFSRSTLELLLVLLHLVKPLLGMHLYAFDRVTECVEDP